MLAGGGGEGAVIPALKFIGQCILVAGAMAVILASVVILEAMVSG